MGPIDMECSCNRADVKCNEEIVVKADVSPLRVC